MNVRLWADRLITQGRGALFGDLGAFSGRHSEALLNDLEAFFFLDPHTLNPSKFMYMSMSHPYG